MRMLLLIVLVLFAPTSVIAQKLPEWYRVYTFEDSIIEMNTTNVILGGEIGRIQFRWVFDHSQALSGDSKLTYKTRLETIEFKCVDQRYRYSEVSLIDSAGKTVQSRLMSSPYEWQNVKSGSVIATIFGPACELIRTKTDPQEARRKLYEQEQADKVSTFARSIIGTLERSRDFRPLIEKFFVADFIQRYLDDENTNWFYNLDRDTAAKASRTELERFYVASLNAGYLTALYLISRSPLSDDEDSIQTESTPEEKMIPADVYQLVNHHQYTLTYKAKTDNYDYLAENIDSVARLRSYTDLLEKIAVSMRKHVKEVRAESSKQYQEMLEGTDLSPRICEHRCLGLPQGTKVFQINPPLLRVQFAEIKGELRIISATDSSNR